VVGQLGAYYRVGTYNVQADKGKLVWVAPLDFQGLVQWLVRRTSPGVVIVDAENPDTPAELRQRTPLRYIPSAFLNDNLSRHVWLKYGTELLPGVDAGRSTPKETRAIWSRSDGRRSGGAVKK